MGNLIRKNEIECWLNNNLKRFCFTVFSSFIVGIIVHMIILVSGIHNHDTVTLIFNNGDWLLSQGKWFVTPLASIEGDFDIFYMSGIIGIISFAIAAGVCVVTWNVENKIIQLIVGITIVCSPSVATMLIYHAADYFGASFLMAVVGSSLIVFGGLFFNIMGIMLITVSIGAYQANISVALMILIISVIIEIINHDSLKTVLKNIVKYVAEAVLATVLYYVLLRIIIAEKQVTLSGYKGIDNMASILSPQVFVNSCYRAVKNFYKYFLLNSLGLDSGKPFVWGILLFLSLLLLIIYYFFKVSASQQGWSALMIGLLVIAGIPLCANAIGVLSQNSSYYNITTSAFCFAALLPAVLYSKYAVLSKKRYALYVVIVISIMINIHWIMEENIVYQELRTINTEYDFKLSSLISRIQSEERYTGDTEVVFIGDSPFAFLEASGTLRAFETEYKTEGYGIRGSYGEMYSDGILSAYLANKYAVNLLVDGEDRILLSHRHDIDEMGVYPASNSIKYLDGQIVVKLSENY